MSAADSRKTERNESGSQKIGRRNSRQQATDAKPHSDPLGFQRDIAGTYDSSELLAEAVLTTLRSSRFPERQSRNI